MKETRFKHTEIGLIPEDWEIRKLGSIFKFIPNNTISRDNLVNQGTVMNVHYGDILIKYGSILDIKNNDIPFINDSVISNSKFNEFAKDGDILIADTAEDEMVCKATELYNIENRKLVSGLHTMWIRPIIEFKPKYLGYFFNSTFYHNQILPLIQGTKVCSVSKGAIKDTYVSIPLENEQNKIASALTSIDNLLLSLDKLIEKKRLIKQGAMQELLTGKKRLPGFTGELVERQVKDLGSIGRGRVISQKEIERSYQHKYPVYSSQTQNNGVMGYIDTYDFEGEYITWTTDGVNAGTVFHRNGLFNCTNVCGTIKLHKDNHLFVSMRLGLETNNYVSTNLANPKLMNNVMKQIVIDLPETIEEQRAIATVLSSMDKEIESLEGKKAKYEQIKQGMMQQLLTGKIRLIS